MSILVQHGHCKVATPTHPFTFSLYTVTMHDQVTGHESDLAPKLMIDNLLNSLCIFKHTIVL